MPTLYITSLSENVPRGEIKRTETQTGRGLLAYALARAGALPPSLEKSGGGIEPLLAYGPHGKPCFPGLGLHFNISHSHGLVACGLSGQPLGVDVERVRRFSPALRERILTAQEAALAAGEDPDLALTQLWTCKESCMKYTGLGLSQGAGAIGFASLGRTPELAGGAGARFQSLLLRRGGQRFWVTVCHRDQEPLVMETVPLPDISPQRQ